MSKIALASSAEHQELKRRTQRARARARRARRFFDRQAGAPTSQHQMATEMDWDEFESAVDKVCKVEAATLAKKALLRRVCLRQF